MAKFSKKAKQTARNQAKSIAIKLNKKLKSLGTNRNYQDKLKNVAEWIKEQSIPVRHIHDLTPKQAIMYLEYRSQFVAQSSLDMERQSIQAMMIHVTGKLSEDNNLPRIKSELSSAKKSRAYSSGQVKTISSSQKERNSLATKIAYSAGLRAHELLTLQKPTERKPNTRPANKTKWHGRVGVIYTVQGKGGLIREVLLPENLSIELEKLKLDTSLEVTDRGIKYNTSYNLAGGKSWSNSFSSASKRNFGWSRGAHGVRHSYAQERMSELRKLGHSRQLALETVSQEMGHFRPEITEVYLR